MYDLIVRIDVLYIMIRHLNSKLPVYLQNIIVRGQYFLKIIKIEYK